MNLYHSSLMTIIQLSSKAPSVQDENYEEKQIVDLGIVGRHDSILNKEELYIKYAPFSDDSELLYR